MKKDLFDAALGGSRGGRFSSGACRPGGARAPALGRARAQIRQGRRSRGARQGNGGRKNCHREVRFHIMLRDILSPLWLWQGLQ